MTAVMNHAARRATRRAARRIIAYRLEAFGVALVVVAFGALPLDAASWLGGVLARALGPLFGAHKTARANLARAMPELDAAAQSRVLRGMWDNIGRTMAEYPHLSKLFTDTARVEVLDPTGLLPKLRDDGLGAIFVGMHFGNWELSPVPGHRAGLRQAHFYRAPNNPYVDTIFQKLRAPLQQESYLPKGAAGARQAVKLLKENTHIGMLADQKLNEGIAAPFFGRDAMTTTAPATLARRMNLPIGAGRVIRRRGARFQIEVAAIEVDHTPDPKADIVSTTVRMNHLLERWIAEHPEQWFWVHRRWPR